MKSQDSSFFCRSPMVILYKRTQYEALGPEITFDGSNAYFYSACCSKRGARPEYHVWGGGLSPGHGERGSASL